jgi:hypothetical protein
MTTIATDEPAFEEGSRLDTDLLAALATGDLDRVVSIYELGARLKEQEGDIDAACFLYTHAFVHALQAGDPRHETLRRVLIGYGREE